MSPRQDEVPALQCAQEDGWDTAQGMLCKGDIAYAQHDYATARSLYAEA